MGEDIASKIFHSFEVTQMNTMLSFFYIFFYISLQVNAKALSKNLAAEKSQEDHWSKSFAALSIHRREDWAVTVKGFNKFVWDFEKTTTENPNGIFASHGSMLIANSEEALKAHDVDAGWDWIRIPGTTTMSVTLNEAKLVVNRNYSPQSSAGGVIFLGTETLSNGVFGMNFNQPDYESADSNHSFPNVKLRFKKSVFFHKNLLVCLGSNIKLTNGPGFKAQTTLFQDKLNRSSSAFFKVDGVSKGMTSPFLAMTPNNLSKGASPTILLDTKGNSYYIPLSSVPHVKIHIQNQTSENQKGNPSTGYYATAWLEHSSVDASYEYAIYVNTPSYPHTAQDAWLPQDDHKKLYQVLKQDHIAHVLRFLSAPDSLTAINPRYGYVIFQPVTTLKWGPIKEVNYRCLIMASESQTELYISISFQDLDFDTKAVLDTQSDVGPRERFRMESKENEVQVTLTLTADVDITIPSIFVHESPADYEPVVRVNSSSASPNRGNKIIFTNLKNGFNIEIKLCK